METVFIKDSDRQRVKRRIRAGELVKFEMWDNCIELHFSVPPETEYIPPRMYGEFGDTLITWRRGEHGG